MGTQFCETSLVLRDRGAPYWDAVLLRGVGSVDRHLILSLVPVLDTQIKIPQIDSEIRKDESVANLLPDDSRHLVTVDFHHGFF